MSSAFNRTILLGNLTSDPESKVLPGGANVTEFGIAVNREFKGKDGAKKKDVLFMPVKCWQKTGEIAAKYLTKGSLVMVEGHLNQRSWDTEAGEKRTIIELVADTLVLMPRTSSPGSDRSESDEDGPF